MARRVGPVKVRQYSLEFKSIISRPLTMNVEPRRTSRVYGTEGRSRATVSAIMSPLARGSFGPLAGPQRDVQTSL